MGPLTVCPIRLSEGWNTQWEPRAEEREGRKREQGKLPRDWDFCMHKSKLGHFFFLALPLFFSSLPVHKREGRPESSPPGTWHTATKVGMVASVARKLEMESPLSRGAWPPRNAIRVCKGRHRAQRARFTPHTPLSLGLHAALPFWYMVHGTWCFRGKGLLRLRQLLH